MSGRGTRATEAERPAPRGDRPLCVRHVDPGHASIGLAGSEAFRARAIEVETAASIDDALQAAPRQVDCVVTAYQLPDGTGLDLLRALRARGSDVPVVLLTDCRPESFAREAIGSDVSDAIWREEDDALERLATAVGTAAERRVPAEHPIARFGPELTELLDGAGVFVWHWDLGTGTVRRWPPTEQLFGIEKSELEPVFDNFVRCVAPEDREEFKTTVQRAVESGEPYHSRYRLDIPHQPDRVFLDERGTPVTAEDETAHLVGVAREVTQSAERRRDLEWERDLNRTVRDALGEAHTRSELEERIVALLADYGYPVVWIGEWNGNQIRPRTVVGDDDIVGALDLDATVAPDGTRPTRLAAESGRPRFLDDLGSRVQVDWYRRAYKRGVRGVAALPLVHSDVSYGILTVFDDAPGEFDLATERHLTDLADTLAAVVHNVETRSGLAAERPITTTVQVTGTDYYLQDLARGVGAAGGVDLTVQETLPQGGQETVQFVSVDDRERDAVLAALECREDVVQSTTAGDGQTLQVLHDGVPPEVVLASLGVRVRSTEVRPERIDLAIETDTKAGLAAAVEALEERAESVSVLSCLQRGDRESPTEGGLLGALTDRQRTVLEAAVRQGYFQQPRDRSATEIAETLDISHPTFLEHLRRVQQKLFDGLLAED